MVTTVPVNAGTGALGGLLGPLGGFGIGLLGKKNFGIPAGMTLAQYLQQRQQATQGTTDLTSSDPGINRFPLDWLIKMAPMILGTLNKGGGGNNPAATPGINPDANTSGAGGFPDWMKILLPVLAATAGGLQNRSQTAESASTTTPKYGDAEEAFKQGLMQKYTDYLNQDPNLTGFEANQLAANNRAYGLRSQDVTGDLSARGITGPAAALAQANLGNQNFAQNTQFRNTVPLIARDLRQQALTSASGFFNTLPYGQNIQSTQKQSGNILGGITGGLAEMLAALYGINVGRR